MVDRSKFNWDQFDAYREENVEDRECSNAFVKGKDMLYVWENAKNRHLAQLFPEGQLVIEKRFSYDRGLDEMRREFADMVDDFRDFVKVFREKLSAIMDPEDNYYRGNFHFADDEAAQRLQIMEMMFNWFSYDRLWENTIEFPWYFQKNNVNRYALNILGHEILLQPGMKLMKTWGKICGWLGLGEQFEEFRIRQSQLTNTKRINGTMCLSIHPLDYATASDNENGWSSCMSWREHGCYRMGTVEMMNSPIVLCSYIKSDKAEMSIGGEPWNSKKWRAWVLVTPECILMNRQYPYHNDSIGEAICKWVRELVQEKIGWKYEDTFSTDLMDTIDRREQDNILPMNIHFQTNFMYNDIGDDDLGYVGLPDNWKYDRCQFRAEINFSGLAQCMWCGDIIEFNDNREDADSLGCRLSQDEWVCEDCGHVMTDEDEVWYGPHGEIWCSDCYNEHCVECSECGGQEYKGNITTICLPYSEKIDQHWFDKMIVDNPGAVDHHHPIYDLLVRRRFSWNHPGEIYRRRHDTDHVCLCSSCFAHLKHRWQQYPTEQVTLIQANNERDEYPDMEFCCDNNDRTYIVDPRNSGFKGIMNVIRPYTYTRAHDWIHTPKDQLKEVEQYYTEQCTRLGEVLDESARLGHTNPYEI